MDWEEDDYGTDQLGRIGGFSLHAGVAVNTRERKKLERICRYIYTSLDETGLSQPVRSKTAIRIEKIRLRPWLLDESLVVENFRDDSKNNLSTHVSSSLVSKCTDVRGKIRNRSKIDFTVFLR